MTMKIAPLLLLLGLLAASTTTRADYVSGTPHKAVVVLDGESFPHAIKDIANPLWLLKFYAPWCGHCKKMAPVLDKLSAQLEGKMAIGKIDCTIHKSLCKEYSVRGYPTLKYVLDGEVHDYPGGRDENAITGFAKRMSAPAIQQVVTYDEALEFTKTTEQGIAFLGYDPKSTPESPSEVYRVFSQVARKQQASAYFLWLTAGPSDDEKRQYSFVHKIEPGFQPKGWEHENDSDKENEKADKVTSEALSAWVQQQNFPLVATFGPNNFHRIGHNGRPLVISIVADMGKNEEQVNAIKAHMLEYIQKSPPEEVDQYYFGLMDGNKWGRFLEQFDINAADNPQTLILDVPKKQYWQNSTYTNLFKFMKAVKDGDIVSETASKSGKKGWMAKLENAFLQHFPYSLGVLLLTVFGIVYTLVPSGDDLRPPYDRADADYDDYGDGDEPPQEEEGAKKEFNENKKDK